MGITGKKLNAKMALTSLKMDKIAIHFLEKKNTNKKLCLRNMIDAPSRQNQSNKVKGHSQSH